VFDRLSDVNIVQGRRRQTWGPDPFCARDPDALSNSRRRHCDDDAIAYAHTHGDAYYKPNCHPDRGRSSYVGPHAAAIAAAPASYGTTFTHGHARRTDCDRIGAATGR
jgi:hypothetical protein